MIKDCGIDVFVNECFIGFVFGMGVMFVGYVIVLMVYCYMVFINFLYNFGGGFMLVVVVFVFLIGLQICNVFIILFSSGIDIIFVVSVWDFEVMIWDYLDLYYRMVVVYFEVQQVIYV